MTKDLTKFAEKFVTTQQAAEMLGVANDRVNRLLIAKNQEAETRSLLACVCAVA